MDKPCLTCGLYLQLGNRRYCTSWCSEYASYNDYTKSQQQKQHTPNAMQQSFDVQMSKVRNWIEIKGKQYDKPNGTNFADTKPNPIGWVHDASKYLDEAYTTLHENMNKSLDKRNAEKLLMKCIHCCQIAMTKIDALENDKLDDKRSWSEPNYK